MTPEYSKITYVYEHIYMNIYFFVHVNEHTKFTQTVRWEQSVFIGADEIGLIRLWWFFLSILFGFCRSVNALKVWR